MGRNTLRDARVGVSSTIVIMIVVLVLVVGGIAFIFTSMSSPAGATGTSSHPPTSSTSTTQASSTASTNTTSSTPTTVEMTIVPPVLLSPGTKQNYTVTFKATGNLTGLYLLTASKLPTTVSFQFASVKFPDALTTPITITLGASATAAPANTTITLTLGSGSTSFTKSVPISIVKYLVLIQGNNYKPANVTVKAGSTVYWFNLDAAAAGAHTVIADNGAFASGTLNQYDVFSFNFPTAGAFTYHDTGHSTMIGQITVTP